MAARMSEETGGRVRDEEGGAFAAVKKLSGKGGREGAEGWKGSGPFLSTVAATAAAVATTGAGAGAAGAAAPSDQE